MFGSSNITVGDFTGRPTDASPAATALALVVDPATDTMAATELQNLPVPAGVVLQDGTAGLSADWDAGSHQIRAETFQSDVATGTAPLTVASTTLVANLNADQLDGQEGSYYATAADVATNTADIATNTAAVAALTSGQNRLRTVIARVDNTAAPPTEVEGDRYLLDDTGASHANWDGAAINDVVQFNSGSWVATSPVEGFVVYSDGSNTDWLYVDDGAPDWTERAVASTDHGSLSGLTDDDHTQYLLGTGTRAGTGLQEFLGLNLTDSTELTIASGAVTVTQGYHTIDTESDAATDDLNTITVAGGEGDILILRAESSARTVVIKHGTGNIQCAEGYDLSLDSDYDYATLIRKDGTNWMAFSGARRMPPYLDNGDTLGGALAGDSYYHDGTTVTNRRKGTNGQVWTMVAGLPDWADSTAGFDAAYGQLTEPPATQNLTTSLAVVDFDVTGPDSGSVADEPNNELTAPATGTYMITGWINAYSDTGAGTDSSLEVICKRDSTHIAHTYAFMSGETARYVHAAFAVISNLTAGDEIRLWAAKGIAGGTYSISDAALTIHRIA